MFTGILFEGLNQTIKDGLERRGAKDVELFLELGNRKGNIRTRLEFDFGSNSGFFTLAFNPTDLKIKVKLDGHFPMKDYPTVFYKLGVDFVVPLSGVDTDEMANRKLAFAIQAIQAVLQ